VSHSQVYFNINLLNKFLAFSVNSTLLLTNGNIPILIGDNEGCKDSKTRVSPSTISSLYADVRIAKTNLSNPIEGSMQLGIYLTFKSKYK
jgi:hypothetical protein